MPMQEIKVNVRVTWILFLVVRSAALNSLSVLTTLPIKRTPAAISATYGTMSRMPSGMSNPNVAAEGFQSVIDSGHQS